MKALHLGSRLALGIAVALLLAAPILAQNAAPQVEARAISVWKTSYEEGGKLVHINGLPLEDGVDVTLFVTIPSGNVIGLDEKQSKVTRITDDKGNDLLETRETGLAFDDLYISDDRKKVVVTIKRAGIPRKRAASIRLVGTLAFMTATKRQQFSQEDVLLALDNTVELGPTRYTITEVAMPEERVEPLKVTLLTDKDFPVLDEMEFLDKEGKVVSHKYGGYGEIADGKTIRSGNSYLLSRKLDTATVRATCWTDLKTETVPFDLEVGLGL